MFNLILRVAVMGTLLSITAGPSITIENKAPKTQTTQSPKVIDPIEIDTRLAALKTILESYDSPMKNEARTFIEVADESNLDWRFLPAIAGMESLFGNRVAPNTHNPFGWGGGVVKL